MKKLTAIIALAAFSLSAYGQYNQQCPKLTAAGLQTNAQFGNSVSISDDAATAIVGAWGGVLGSTGQAVILCRNTSTNTWSQGQILTGTGANGGANQGVCVAISGDGNTAIVGGPNDNNGAGAAWVFVRNGNTWSQQAKLVGSGATGNAFQGYSVALSYDGNIAVIGGPSDNNAYGAFWIFTRSGGTWVQTGGKNVGSGAVGFTGAQQGYSVAISGDGQTIAEGAIFDGYGNNGAVYIFKNTGASWTQEAKVSGNTSYNLGSSVALSFNGNTVVMGAARGFDYVGGAMVATRNGSNWAFDNNSVLLRGSGAIGNAQQGGSVDISADGNTVVIGGGANTFSNNATLSVGDSWIFTKSGSLWNELNKYQGTANVGNSQQGTSVSISADGNTFITGGFADNNMNGAVWVFSKTIPVVTTKVDELSSINIQLYPNPTQDRISIQSTDPVDNELMGIDGKILIKRNAEKVVDLSTLPSGLYLMNLYTKEGVKIRSERIIKH